MLAPNSVSPGLLPQSPPDPELAGRRATHSRDELRQKFQEFAAGTVFKQMLKSLRKTHDKPAYLHGGQAEETFRNLLDERVAEQLAAERGAAFAEPLFQSFARRV